MEHREKIDKELDLRVMADTIVMLSSAVQTQNDIILCLLHKFNIKQDLPFWTTKEGMEEDVGPKVKACIESVRSLYGRSEID